MSILDTLAPITSTPVAAIRLDRNAVVKALAADADAFGYAVARFRLDADHTAWNPAGTRADRRDFTGPGLITYERQSGVIVARYGA